MAAAKGLVEFLRSAVAEFKDGKLTCWTASQATVNPDGAKNQIEGDIVQTTTPF